jgi:hypothetical protein
VQRGDGAGEDEYAGADRVADAKGGEIQYAERTYERRTVPAVGFALERFNRLA